MKELMVKSMQENRSLLMSDVIAQRTLSKQFSKLQAGEDLTDIEAFQMFKRV